MWIPDLYFEKVRSNSDIHLHGQPYAKVEKGWKTTFERSNPSQLQHSYVYEGEIPRIVFSSSYSVSTQCNYDLSNMPFDTQVCLMDTVFQDNSDMYVKLVPASLEYNGNLDLLEFTVVDFAICTGILQGKNTTRIHLILNRRLQSVFLTIFLPTLIVNIIVFTTLYMDRVHFNTSIMVNLTALLVFTSM